MLKKLFVTAAAAAAVSVPLAGVAWADKPDDPGSNAADGISKGGVPAKAGTAVADLGLPTDPPSAFPNNKLSPPDKEGSPRAFSRLGVQGGRKVGGQRFYRLWGAPRSYVWLGRDHHQLWPHRSRVGHEAFHAWVRSREWASSQLQ